MVQIYLHATVLGTQYYVLICLVIVRVNNGRSQAMCQIQEPYSFEKNQQFMSFRE